MPSAVVFCVVGALLLTACHRSVSPEEKKLGQELRRALVQHSYVAAENLARRLSELNPRKNGAWDRLLQAQCGQGHFQQAKQTLTDWRTAVRQPSSKLDEYAGDLAFKTKNPGEALRAWRKALDARPDNLRVLTKIARVEQDLHRWTESHASWTAVLQLLHQSADAFVQRAMCRRHLHRWTEALADLRRAQEIAPHDPAVVHGAEIFQRLSKVLAEIRDLDLQLAVSPTDATLLADRSLLFLRAGDFELALEDGESAGRLAPWAMRPKLFAGLALLQLGHQRDAQKRSIHPSLRMETFTPEFLETIRRLDSEISVERKNAELYAARAWQLNEIGQPALALQDAENATQFDPKSAGGAAEKGYALMKLGQNEKAFAEIVQATAFDPNYATAWQYRGELEMEQKKYEAAIESFSHALSLYKTAAVLEKREACYRQTGNDMKAGEDQRALEELTAGTLR